jgi:hypothetical protein
MIGAGLVGSLLLAGYGMRAEAREPQEKGKGTVGDVVAILVQKPFPLQERHATIRHAVLQRLRLDAMAQRALAQHWRTLTPPQRHECVGLGADLLEASSMTRMAHANSGPQRVRDVKETIEQDQAAVSTESRNERDAPAAVEDRLRHTEDD